MDEHVLTFFNKEKELRTQNIINLSILFNTYIYKNTFYLCPTKKYNQKYQSKILI